MLLSNAIVHTAPVWVNDEPVDLTSWGLPECAD